VSNRHVQSIRCFWCCVELFILWFHSSLWPCNRRNQTPRRQASSRCPLQIGGTNTPVARGLRRGVCARPRAPPSAGKFATDCGEQLLADWQVTRG
jgi:hypothetical protein